MCIKLMSITWRGLYFTCHVVNDCLQAWAAILRAEHRVKEGQAVDLHLGTACQMGKPAWCCKLSVFEQPHHGKVKDLQSKLSKFEGLCNNVSVISQSHCSNLLWTEQRWQQMCSWDRIAL